MCCSLPVEQSSTALICKENVMEPVVLALASDERYFPGLYCAVASALSHLDVTSKVDLKVLDGGISGTSRDTLSKLILLPHLLDVQRLIYLDCDVLVFRDLSELFDLELSHGKILAAVPDSETLTLSCDSQAVADAMNLPADRLYFNSGVMLLNLYELRKQNFTKQSLEFLKNWRGYYRFHDQSAFNFLLQGWIDELPEYWNRASWRFDAQQNNDLDCVLHYTSLAPWLGGTRGPAQVLFERFAVNAGLPVNRQIGAFKKSQQQQLFRNALAPFRVLGFPLLSLLYKIAGQKEKCVAYKKAARYWFDYIRNAPTRRQLHHKRAEQIQRMKFKFAVFKSAT
ncbi:MAG: hypothetical protein DME61_08245 [Verrucomicrobia bacterium]|nr:MAG: hypothetical protein DME61_08245 [Verrucomicrobiota bacterium]